MKIESLFKFSLYLLFLIAPFLSPITERYPLGGVKDVLQILIIFSLLFFIRRKVLVSSYFIILLLLFVLYMFSHVPSYAGGLLILDGVRHQLGYILIFSLLCVSKSFFTEKMLNTIFYIILSQSVVISMVALTEFYDDSIISFLYGIPKYQMNHVDLAAGQRVISTLGNPINLSGYMVFSYLIAFYLYTNDKVGSISFYILTATFLLVTFLTLSRLGLIAFLSVLLLSNMFFLRARNAILLFSLIFISILYLIFDGGFLLRNFDVELLFSRFFNLLDSGTYLENARIRNWFYAFQLIETPFDFFWGKGLGVSNSDINKGGVLIENSFITYIVEVGLIGLLFLALLIFYTISKIWQTNSIKSFGNFLLLYIIFFIVMSLGNDFVKNFPFVFYFWVFIGIYHNMEKRI